jgi:DNA-binding CsgD family transcriptional regulator
LPWLDDIDLRDARGLSRSFRATDTVAEVRREAMDALAHMVPADGLSWDGAGATGPAHRGAQLGRCEVVHAAGADYVISVGVPSPPDHAVVIGLARRDRTFSERDRDLLDLVAPTIQRALGMAGARDRCDRALAADPPAGTAVVLLDAWGEIEVSSLEAERWLTEHFGAAEHPGWLPGPVAEWLALPPRPPLVSVHAGRRLMVMLLPGDPHALLLEEELDRFRADALVGLGLTPREREVLEAARAIADEGAIADELFLSLHAVHERLERVEAKLGVHTGAEAIAEALRASA